MTKKLPRDDRGMTQRQRTAEINKLSKWIKAHRKADKNLKLGRKMYKLFKENVDNCEDDSGEECGYQALNWAKAHFWKLRIKATMPKFDELYKMLVAGKYTEKKPFVYGDIDNHVWAEETQDGKGDNKLGKVRVIIQESLSNCADDNTHLFICRDPMKNHRTVRIATAWKKETKNCIGGLEKPSLKTYRRTNWEVKHSDCRDYGDVLKDEPFSDHIESDFIDHKIEHALWVLKCAYDQVVTKKGKSQQWSK